MVYGSGCLQQKSWHSVAKFVEAWTNQSMDKHEFGAQPFVAQPFGAPGAPAFLVPAPFALGACACFRSMIWVSLESLWEGPLYTVTKPPKIETSWSFMKVPAWYTVYCSCLQTCPSYQTWGQWQWTRDVPPCHLGVLFLQKVSAGPLNGCAGPSTFPSAIWHPGGNGLFPAKTPPCTTTKGKKGQMTTVAYGTGTGTKVIPSMVSVRDGKLHWHVQESNLSQNGYGFF